VLFYAEFRGVVGDFKALAVLVPGRFESLVARADGVADIIFNPAETLLTAAAKRAGTPACTGLYMLIAQAVEAESIWQGCSMPPNLAETLMKELHLL